MMAMARRISARSAARALRLASRILKRSKAIRASITSSTAKLARATCSRNSRMSARAGTAVTVVPPAPPAPTDDRTTPWACNVRTASRTAARLTSSRRASSRSGGNWSPTCSSPARIRLSTQARTTSNARIEPRSLSSAPSPRSFAAPSGCPAMTTSVSPCQGAPCAPPVGNLVRTPSEPFRTLQNPVTITSNARRTTSQPAEPTVRLSPALPTPDRGGRLLTGQWSDLTVKTTPIGQTIFPASSTQWSDHWATRTEEP